MSNPAPAVERYNEAIYVGEVHRQCVQAVLAIDALNAALGRYVELQRSAPIEEAREIAILHLDIFRNLHSFLSHTSNISKLLWPADRTAQARGEQLRALLHIDPGAELENRRLRNHLEHYDERLDAWRAAHRTIFQDTIGEREDFGGVDPETALRWYAPRSRTFWFRSEAYNIDALYRAVNDLLAVSGNVFNTVSNPAYRYPDLGNEA